MIEASRVSSKRVGSVLAPPTPSGETSFHFSDNLSAFSTPSIGAEEYEFGSLFDGGVHGEGSFQSSTERFDFDMEDDVLPELRRVVGIT
jgi:hypothetical protein